ncbi:hypothetical protein SESBI_11569 [Sesbania bispinosa]|nr:hypothetical protein SESBI_11569 [Sesbania bispinosa]
MHHHASVFGLFLEPNWQWQRPYSIWTLDDPKKRAVIVLQSIGYALHLLSRQHYEASKGNIYNRRRRLMAEPFHARVLWLPHFKWDKGVVDDTS